MTGHSRTLTMQTILSVIITEHGGAETSEALRNILLI